MRQKIEIRVRQRAVGSIAFDESAAGLAQRGAFRTPDGFMLHLPAYITLDWQTTGGWQPLVSNLRARVLIDDNSGTELGLALDSSWYEPANPRLEDKPLELELRGSLEALQILEKRRNGMAPKLWVQLSGEVSRTFSMRFQDGSTCDARSVPDRIYGEMHLSYPQETWAAMVDAIGVNSHVIVEMPVRKDVPELWKEIFGPVAEARRGLVRGGDDGWKAAVGAVRLALERWRDLEPEAFGPGWNPPKRDDREQWTKRQRIDAVRWALHQFAHLSPHSSAENWTRNDAALALAALAGLLGYRDP
ncbi:MAG TPA: hypothetical protein VHO06_18935 [Polyangia bacterium]|nr:hypothetical protein [Polyangia bacterium]